MSNDRRGAGIGVGIAIGAGIGVALGVAMDNIGLWLAVGNCHRSSHRHWTVADGQGDA